MRNSKKRREEELLRKKVSDLKAMWEKLTAEKRKTAFGQRIEQKLEDAQTELRNFLSKR